MVFYLKHLSNLKICVQQGVIINGCIVEHHIINKKVYGSIITPRRDIGNGGKVTTIHNSPIVPLIDWIKIDYLKIVIRNFRKFLETEFVGSNLSTSLLDYLIDIND